MSTADLRCLAAFRSVDPLGMSWRGDWSATVSYLYGDAVVDGGLTYVCKVQQSIAQVPGATPASWVEITAAGGGGGIISVSGQVGGGVVATTAAGAVTVTSGLLAGPGITITNSLVDEGQTIDNTGVLSLAGQSGDVKMTGSNGITIVAAAGSIEIQGVGPVLGSFNSDETQSVSAANAVTPIKHNKEIRSAGGVVLDPAGSGGIQVPEDGLYQITSTVNIRHKTGPGNVNCLLWFQVDGLDVDSSCIQGTVADDGTFEQSVSFTLNTIIGMEGNTILGVVFASADESITADAIPASTSPYPCPAVSSITTTVVRLADLP